jgi:hypothetical protein
LGHHDVIRTLELKVMNCWGGGVEDNLSLQGPLNAYDRIRNHKLALIKSASFFTFWICSSIESCFGTDAIEIDDEGIASPLSSASTGL